VGGALKDGTAQGTRASMDQYLRFPVETPEDFQKLKKRYRAVGSLSPACWRELVLPGWRRSDHVLVLGRSCSTLRFSWRAREWMGTDPAYSLRPPAAIVGRRASTGRNV